MTRHFYLEKSQQEHYMKIFMPLKRNKIKVELMN